MNRISLARLCLVWAFAAALCVPCTAAADEASEAQLQFELGEKLYKEGKYEEALDRFIASNRLAPNANVVFNIAQTFQFLKRNVAAFNWYVTYLGFELPADKQAIAQQKLTELGKRVAVIDVQTTPPGAELFVDRTELGSVGTSPRKLAVEPGPHRIIARLKGYREAAEQSDVQTGSERQALLTLEPIVGTLSVTSSPPGAQVQREGATEILGKTPLSATLPVGEVRIVVALPGYIEQRRQAIISDGAVTELDVPLQASPNRVAVLSVKGNVKGARVLLDGTSVGTSPLTLSDLPPGTRRIDVTARGRQTWSTELTLEAGAATRVDYDLADPNDRVWPGWRYIGYGVGGAVFLAGGFVGLSALSGKSSFYDDPTTEKMDSVEGKNLTADILMGSGIALIGATLTWDLLRPEDPSSTGSVSLDR